MPSATRNTLFTSFAYHVLLKFQHIIINFRKVLLIITFMMIYSVIGLQTFSSTIFQELYVIICHLAGIRKSFDLAETSVQRRAQLIPSQCYISRCQIFIVYKYRERYIGKVIGLKSYLGIWQHPIFPILSHQKFVPAFIFWWGSKISVDPH